ncbi:AfsR/SARP family transcriptional regulator [Streptomyces sulphureus]|uniref:AfsR/SARP family transcriptional regulator n=1 Tax=Streptomyces sulphureus TaxID=47758 RepID=UPI00037346BF|nr:AfsR/SARP family transcriptional regulator [Streptomyces sulphureus]
MGAANHTGHGTEWAQHLRFTLLGPVRATHGERSLGMGSPQQRALLAALLLRRGRTATAEELIDDIWGEEPPERAKAALRTYASRLRKALGSSAEVLVSESGGYALRTAGFATVDLEQAVHLADEAEQATAAGDHTKARELYARALELWDGESLAQIPGPNAENQRARLEEWRLGLQEHRIGLDLRTGAHADVVSELTALTAAHPLREGLRELLMLALYRSGRQAEALAVYEDTRRLLAEELGVDPRSELSELHQRILEADEGLTFEADEPAQVPVTFTKPAQLPATVADFTGRRAFVEELSDQLSAAGGTVMAVSAVAGIGGVGKTTLAVHVAHAAADRFPDGQLYVDLQGAGPAPADPQAVLGSFLRALGAPDSSIPEGVEERAALFRSLLAGRRVLTLLDNARDAAQVRSLLPGTSGCAALLTSRARMVDLAGAHLVDLDVMSPEEAMTLFTRIVGAERVAAEREAAMDVVAACGFLPLAIRIAAARLAARRTWTVTVLASKLADERRRLDELKVGDQAVKASFELGYSQLEHEQARAFRLLGLADGPDISLTAAAAMLDRGDEETEDLLESLVDTSLLESAAPGRYRFHDLVRLFARACAERDEQPPSERDEALARLLDFYLATGRNFRARDQPDELLTQHLEPTRHSGLAFRDNSEAVAWLFAESACFLACARQSVGEAGLRAAVDLLMATADLSEAGVNIREYERVAEELSVAAHTAGDMHAEARARSVLTAVHFTTGQFDKADSEAKVAGALGEAADDRISSSFAVNDRGIVAIYQNRPRDAERHLTQALERFRAYGNESSEASALCNLARARVQLGEAHEAIPLAQQAVEIYRRTDASMRLANGCYTLGIAFAAAERWHAANAEFTRALDLFDRTRQHLWAGMAHFRLAELHLSTDQPAAAARHAERALGLRGIGGEWRRGTILLLLGRALHRLGQSDRARACWSEALAVFERLGSDEAAVARGLLTPVVAA